MAFAQGVDGLSDLADDLPADGEANGGGDALVPEDIDPLEEAQGLAIDEAPPPPPPPPPDFSNGAFER